jgi:hypothetical protein
MTDIMLDLETLSTRPHAVILTIGAIRFKRGEVWDKNIDLDNLDVFYRRIHIKSCEQAGLHICEETKNWWNKQDVNMQYEALKNPDRVDLSQALREFKTWFGANSRTKIWGNGSGFDCSILGEAYKRCGMTPPWKFWMERDLRTIMDIAYVRSLDLPQSNKHHALFDCYRQIIGFQMCEKKINL